MSGDPTYDFLASGGTAQVPGNSGDPTYDFLASGGNTSSEERITTPSQDYPIQIADPKSGKIYYTRAPSPVTGQDTWLGGVLGKALTGTAAGASGLFTAATGYGRADTGGSMLHEMAEDFRSGAARVPDYKGGDNPGPNIPGTEIGLPSPNQFLGFPTNPAAWPGDLGKGAASLTKIAGGSPQTAADVGTVTENLAPLVAPLVLSKGEGILRDTTESQIEPPVAEGGEYTPPAAAKPTVRDQILADSKKAGYVVPPATSNPSLINRTAEAFAGKANVAQAASIKNQGITNSLARTALGLPDDAPLTADTMAVSRAPANAVYEQVKNAGPIQVDPQYHVDLDALTKTSNIIQKDLPEYASGAQTQIKSLSDSLRPPSGSIDSETAVELSKDLRYSASSNYSASARTGDPNLKTLARAQSDAAAAVEDQIERHLNSIGQADLSQAWDDARTHIAKTYSVQNALDGAGNVDAMKLGKQLIKGKPLSGELETAANFANAFPKAARVLPGKESMPGMSPLDVYGSVAASLAAGNPAPMLLGPGRMAMRSLALSKLGQNLGKP